MNNMTIYDNRKMPFANLGKNVTGASSVEEAIKLGGADWKTGKIPVQLCGGKKVPGQYEIVRLDTMEVLSPKTVRENYVNMQHDEAMRFMNDMIDSGDIQIETLGTLGGGKRFWILAKMPTTLIGGDETEPYICFSDNHDGNGSIKVCMTPIRVVCSNTLNAAFKNAARSWSTRHTKNVMSRIDEAKRSLNLAHEYMAELADYAEAAIKTRIDDREVEYILHNFFDPKPKKDNAGLIKEPSKAQLDHANDKKKAFYVCYDAPDIAKFKGTAWGVLNAMSDLIAHSMPHRNTADYEENNWASIMDGAPLFDKMVDALCVK